MNIIPEETPPKNSNPPARTPMLIQYQEIKARHPDSILFYRMGDFYELFFEDALTAAPILEVQLTARDKNAASPIPMCGVPYHSVTGYIQRLVAKGFKVAICEQMEEASSTKGLVRRDVTRIVTPSLIPDPDLVSDDVLNILLCMVPLSDFEFEVAALDLLKGQVKLGRVDPNTFNELVLQLGPKELLAHSDFLQTETCTTLKKLFPSLVFTARDTFFPSEISESKTLHALALYLQETQKISDLPHLRNPLPLFESNALQLDSTTCAALELIRSNSPEQDATSLFHTLDNTVTPMGKRLLKEWLVSPLNKKEAITSRHEAVGELTRKPDLGEQLRGLLSKVRDLERLTTKTVLGLAMPRDLVAIRAVQNVIPELKATLTTVGSKTLNARAALLNPLPGLTLLLETALEDYPPVTLRDGGIFRSAYHPQVAEYRGLSQDAKTTIAGIEAREKERTGISSLKIKYSKVFGYTIEITKSHLVKTPPEYIRKQTIAGGERFITEELKTFEEKVVTAEEKLKRLEEALFVETRQKVAAESTALFLNASVIAEIDVLIGFSRAARENGYVKPKMHAGWDLTIEDGRHPVIERLLPSGKFIPNSISMDQNDCRTLIITGPNMGGKSTIMRQVALISIMAQAGCFVPAKSAQLPLIDAIFTRIGSSDDLAHGRSTFMVEMTEVGRILEKATSRSLIVIDEIGRGTSTYDGLSLAWSILEYIHARVSAKTLFATHFQELTEIEKKLRGVRNVNVLVEKWKDEIVFLHRLAPGICNRSYGIEVARLAGLPPEVLSRAKNILGHLEGQSQKNTRVRSRALEGHDNQMVFFDVGEPPETLTQTDA